MSLALALVGGHKNRQGDRGLVLQEGETWFAESALVIVIVHGFLNPPESSYAISWPLLFSLIAVGYWFYSMGEDRGTYSAAQVFVLLAAAIVAIVLLVPNIYMTFTGSETSDLLTSMVTLVVVLGLLAPPLHIIMRPKRWWLAAAAGGAAVAGLAIALAV